MNEDILLEGLPALRTENNYYLVYSPYQRVFAKIPQESIKNPTIIRNLKSNGLFDFPKSAPSVAPGIKVVLNITKKCNLFCKYCWADASPLESSKMTADTALNIVKNLYSSHRIERIHFMGGEPTTNFKAIKAVTTFLSDANSDDMPVLYVTTNGVMSERIRQWLITHKFALTISWDGLDKAQMNQRSYMDGSATGPEVMKSIERFAKEDLHIRIRMTASKLNLQYLYESVNWLADHGAKYIHIEPVSPDGRGSAFSKTFAVDPEEFANEFFRIVELAEEKEIWMINSNFANLFTPKTHYCSSLKNRAYNFNPDGSISHCYKVQSKDDELAEQFVVGHYQDEGARFNVDESKSRKLSGVQVSDYPICDDHYLRNFYSGGCTYRNLAATGSWNEVDKTMHQMSNLMLRRAILHIFEQASKGKASALEGYIHFYQALASHANANNGAANTPTYINGQLGNTSMLDKVEFVSIPMTSMDPLVDIDACDICI